VALLVGALLAVAVGLFATSIGLDRDRAFYPVVTIVIALRARHCPVVAAAQPALEADGAGRLRNESFCHQIKPTHPGVTWNFASLYLSGRSRVGPARRHAGR
jgi:hypothetical protein